MLGLLVASRMMNAAEHTEVKISQVGTGNYRNDWLRSAKATHMRPFLSIRTNAAFTLIELIVAILIIVILMGLLFPAIAMVRNSVNRGAATSVVAGLHMALDVYFQEDPRKRYPPVDTGGTFQTRMVISGDDLALDLLRPKGLEWRLEQVDGTAGHLLDPWGRAYRYALDENMDGTIDRPAPQSDWNGKDREPYAYVWSYGRPDKDDTLPANAERWIYHPVQP